jgi:transcriptional regulator with XRE-family HTH domain
LEFGQWIQALRIGQELDLRTLATQSGVDIGTISRLENGKTKATLLTALRLCRALQATGPDLYLAVSGKPSSVREPTDNKAATAPVQADIEQLLALYRACPSVEQSWLADLLYQVFSRLCVERLAPPDSAEPYFGPADVRKLLFDSPLYRFELRYPQAFSASDIVSLTRGGGVVTQVDIGEYLARLRREKEMTQMHFNLLTKLPQTHISSLEAGAVERVKLADVLSVDVQLGQEGIVFALYWSAYTLVDWLMISQEKLVEQSLQLATLFLTMCRWLSVYHQNSLWLSHLRETQPGQS